MAWNTVYETADAAMRCGTDVHMLWIAGAAVECGLLLPIYIRAGEARRGRILRALAVLLLLDEGVKYAVVLAAGVSILPYLPMHLCSLLAVPAAFFAFSRHAEAGEALYALALPASVLAMLFPGWLSLPPDSLLSVHSFSYHILLFLMAFLPVAAGEIRPDARRLPSVFSCLVPQVIFAAGMNAGCGTNFFFLRPVDAVPFAVLAGRYGEGVYPLLLSVAAALVWGLLYLPWEVFRKCRKFAEIRYRKRLDMRGNL